MIQIDNIVLVTGINSFTGQYVSSLLKSLGYIVHGTTNNSSFDSEFTHFLDITDLKNVNDVLTRVKPNYIIHLAAVTYVAHENVSEIYLTNLVGTRNLFYSLTSNSDCLNQIKRVLLASSANIYGNALSPLGLVETSPVAPINDYAISKACMELSIKNWSDLVPITIVRPFNYTGVGQSLKFLIPKLIYAYSHKKTFIELGNIDISRDFTDVRDVANAYVKLMISETDGIFNICSGISHTIRDIIATISEISNHSMDVIINPTYVRKDDIILLNGNPNKLKSIYPEWKPRPFADTLKWMYESQFER